MATRLKYILIGGGGLVLLVGAAMLLASRENLEGLAASNDAADRVAAAERLAARTDEKSVRLMAQLGEDPDLRVALSAVRAMGRARIPACRESLRKIARSDADARLRGEAAAAMGYFEETEPTDLAAMLQGAPSADVRAGAAKGLSRLKAPAALPQLLAALEDRDQRVRVWAITAIHAITPGIRFDYAAEDEPGAQREKINHIRAKLRQMGKL